MRELAKICSTCLMHLGLIDKGADWPIRLVPDHKRIPFSPMSTRKTLKLICTDSQFLVPFGVLVVGIALLIGLRT
jgi:hypothetical protein